MSKLRILEYYNNPILWVLDQNPEEPNVVLGMAVSDHVEIFCYVPRNILNDYTSKKICLRTLYDTIQSFWVVAYSRPKKDLTKEQVLAFDYLPDYGYYHEDCNFDRYSFRGESRSSSDCGKDD